MANIKKLKDLLKNFMTKTLANDMKVLDATGLSKVRDLVKEDLAKKQDVTDYLSVERLGPYLYKVTFEKIPEYNESLVDGKYVYNCSSYIRNKKMYRNLDFFYDNTAEFIVVTKQFTGTGFIYGMEDEHLDYKKIGQLPFHLNDGKNDTTNIMVSSHILYNDFNEYAGSGAKDKDITLIPYFVLTNINNMSELETKMNNYLSNLFIPTVLSGLGYLMQYMVSDGTITKVITPKNDGSGYEIIDISYLPKIVNFKWINKARILERNDSLLQLRPNGIERWNLIEDGATLEDLRFTKCYETPDRLSEFIGESGTTKMSTDVQLEAVYDIAHSKYLTRIRNGELWQTVHSVVYGEKGIEHLWVQENYKKDYIASSSEGGSNIQKVNNIILSGNKSTTITIESGSQIINAYAMIGNVFSPPISITINNNVIVFTLETEISEDINCYVIYNKEE